MSEEQKQYPNDLKVGFGKYKDQLLRYVAKNDLEFFRQIETLYYSKYNIRKQEYYRTLKKQYVINDGVSNLEVYEKEIQEVVRLLENKKTSKEIVGYLQTNYKYNSSDCSVIISGANVIIRKRFQVERNSLLDIHMMRYEKLYEDNFNPNLDHIPAGYRKAMKCEHYLVAMETLFQKEKLLGIHSKKFKLLANQSTLQRADLEFDIKELSVKERLEVLQLLNKAKSQDTLIRPITFNTDPVPETHIQQGTVIQQIEAPIKLAKQTDLTLEKEQEEVKSTGKTLDQVKQTLQDKVKELYEKKNKS